MEPKESFLCQQEMDPIWRQENPANDLGLHFCILKCMFIISTPVSAQHPKMGSSQQIPRIKIYLYFSYSSSNLYMRNTFCKF
jgi:hypothetical protein